MTRDRRATVTVGVTLAGLELLREAAGELIQLDRTFAELTALIGEERARSDDVTLEATRRADWFADRGARRPVAQAIESLRDDAIRGRLP